MIQLCKGEDTAQCTFGTESISSLAPKTWEICEIKNAKSSDIFKEKIKFCPTDKCPCRLCKRYIGNVGFAEPCSKEIMHKYSYCHFIILF